MQIKIKGLIPKKLAGGDIGFYWQPSTPERKSGWKALALGSDLQRAIKLAEERNDEIRRWKDGGGKPRAVKRYVAPRTFGDVIRRYREEHLAKHSANTQRTAKTPLARLEAWAGDKAVSYITRARVRTLRDAMMDEGGTGYLGHHAAFAVLSMGRQVMAFAADHDIIAAEANPFLRFGLGKPAPRSLFWEDRHVQALLAAAKKAGAPSIGLALEIGLYTGQREADILKLNLNSWHVLPRETLRISQEEFDLLASNDGPNAGQVMGVRVRQGKTGRWIGAPVEGYTRRKVEAAIALAKSIGSMAILNDERTQKPWTQDAFIHKFGEVRAAAVAELRDAGDDMLADELAALWFSDTRRSCIVHLGDIGISDQGISSLSGHTLATIKAILEVYMPRTTTMAATTIAARVTSLNDARKDKEARENMG